MSVVVGKGPVQPENEVNAGRCKETTSAPSGMTRRNRQAGVYALDRDGPELEGVAGGEKRTEERTGGKGRPPVQSSIIGRRSLGKNGLRAGDSHTQYLQRAWMDTASYRNRSIHAHPTYGGTYIGTTKGDP